MVPVAHVRLLTMKDGKAYEKRAASLHRLVRHCVLKVLNLVPPIDSVRIQEAWTFGQIVLTRRQEYIEARLCAPLPSVR